MTCPACDCPNTSVFDTRPVKKLSTQRRRKCISCGYRFTTHEKPDVVNVDVIKQRLAKGERPGWIKEADGEWVCAGKVASERIKEMENAKKKTIEQRRQELLSY